MLKFHRAIFCYYVLRFYRDMHSWIIMITLPTVVDTWLFTGDNDRANNPVWFTPLLDKKLDFDSVLRILSGDAFYERNKVDVAKLQAEIGKPITDIWDTHPIFYKYPHLKMFARNKDFEAMWAKMKNGDDKEKQK